MTCGWTRSDYGRSTWSRSPAPSRPATVTASSTGACSPRPAPRPARRSATGRRRSPGAWPTRSSWPAPSAACWRSPGPWHRQTWSCPPTAGSAAFAPDAAAEAAARAQAALSQLASAATALGQALAAVAGARGGAPADGQLTALRAALQQAAAFGVDGAYPAGDADASALTTLATGIQQELAARQAAAAPTGQPDPGAVDPAAAVQTAQAVFGRDFLLLPRLAAADLAAPWPRRPRSSVT